MQIPSGPEALLHIKAGYMTAADPSMPKMNDIPLATKGGSIHDQLLLRITRTATDEFPREKLLRVRFVPMIKTVSDGF